LRAATNDDDDDDDDDDDFVNDGPLAWMRPYLTVFGMTEGKTLNFALPFDLDDDSKNFNSDEQTAAAAARLREEASRTLTNIGAEERERRGQAATVFAVLTAMYAVWSSLIADDGGLAGHLIRFGIVLPLFFTFGYKLSEETGLWNLAQNGLWDVDGQGIKKIDDVNVAQAILDKVNAMNADTAIRAAVIAAVFAILPQSTSVPLVFSVVIFAGKQEGWLVDGLVLLQASHTPIALPVFADHQSKQSCMPWMERSHHPQMNKWSSELLLESCIPHPRMMATFCWWKIWNIQQKHNCLTMEMMKGMRLAVELHANQTQTTKECSTLLSPP
jgi:hypothetical protein